MDEGRSTAKPCEKQVVDPRANTYVLSTGSVQPARPESDDEGLTQSARFSSLHGMPGFSPADRRLIFSAQCRLLATRAENGLPVDVRSFLNLIRSFRELLVAGVAR